MNAHLAISEIIRNYAIVAGGFLGIAIALWRGISLSRQATAAQSQAKLADRSYATELFRKAVELLGDGKLEVRLGAIYTLRQLEADYPEFSKPILMVMAAFVRDQTEDEPAASQEDDVQEALNALGKRLQQ